MPLRTLPLTTFRLRLRALLGPLLLSGLTSGCERRPLDDNLLVGSAHAQDSGATAGMDGLALPSWFEGAWWNGPLPSWQPAALRAAEESLATMTLPQPAGWPEPPAYIQPSDLQGTLYEPFGRYYAEVVARTSPERAAQPADRAESIHLTLEGEPWVQVSADGEFRIQWQTRAPQLPGRVYWGTHLPDQWIAVGRYRRNIPVLAQQLATTHAVVDAIPRLERPAYDVAGLRARGGGIIEYRLEQPTMDGRGNRLYDRRFAYRRDAEGRYERVPTLTQGPFVDWDGANFVISFETDAPVAATVVTLRAGEGLQHFGGEGTGTVFEIPVGEPGPGEPVWYGIALQQQGGPVLPQEPGLFRGRPAPGTAFSFAVMSDSRAGVGPGEESYEGTNRLLLKRFMVEAMRQQVDFVVFPGDLVDGYVTQPADLTVQLRAWRDSSQLIARWIPIFEGVGNHDVVADAWENGVQRSRVDFPASEEVFAQAFVNPRNGPLNEGEGSPPYQETVYSWDWGSAHFVMLNSNYWWTNEYDIGVADIQSHNREGYLMDAQLAWLDADLTEARARGQQQLFLFVHEPPFPNGGHPQDAMYWDGLPVVVARRDAFIRLAMRHGVSAIFAGDEHNYSRTRVDAAIEASYPGTLQAVTTGGCGAPFYAQDTGLPWSDRVEAFSAQQNFVVVTVEPDRAVLRAWGDTGQLLDEVVLPAVMTGSP
jgi:3',5'-cyclic AMP phosphodiesterase CpdA